MNEQSGLLVAGGGANDPIEGTSPVRALTADPFCRFCGHELDVTMVDLGSHPLCESFIPPESIEEPEVFYPLKVRVCSNCYLVQVAEFVSPEQIFDDYAYFSSFSTAWLRHASEFVDLMINRFALDSRSRIMEIGSNDGYLLQYFVEKGYDALGVEPSFTVREAAEARGIPTVGKFFGEDFARSLSEDGYRADVVIANNVLAQTPDLNGFVAGISLILAMDGVATLEFPHLMRLIEGNQFDTIYHEHFSYFSLRTASSIFGAHELEIFDVQELPTHGGSLRLFVKHRADDSKSVSSRVGRLLDEEADFGLFDLSTYERFGDKVAATKRSVLSVLIDAKDRGDRIAIYGAAGKGNTLLNYCGIDTGFIDFACDRNPYKHGRYTPGTHIPIFPPSRIREREPDLVLILPWNLAEEIMDDLSYIREWGGRFVVPIPHARVHDPVGVESVHDR